MVNTMHLNAVIILLHDIFSRYRNVYHSIILFAQNTDAVSTIMLDMQSNSQMKLTKSLKYKIIRFQRKIVLTCMAPLVP